MRVVIAIGGNALRDVDDPTGLPKRMVAEVLAPAIAAIARDHDVLVTHGSGPQVGRLASSTSGPNEVPLDVVDAEVDGRLGYLLAREIGGALPGRDVATVLTQVDVDPDDPAFADPTKPVGPVVDAAEAADLASRHGWTFRAVEPRTDSARYRRVVPSPMPRAVMELRAIEVLVGAHVLVVAGGGGGIPVHVDATGRRTGVEAVVDKDRTSALLATALGAERLVLLTDVDAVVDGFGTDRARPIGRVRAAALATRSFRQARWDRRSKPRSASSPRPAAPRRSVASPTSPRSSPAVAAPRSSAERLPGRHEPSRVQATRPMTAARPRPVSIAGKRNNSSRLISAWIRASMCSS